MRQTVIIGVLIGVIVSCSPKVTTNITQSYTALSSEQNVLVIGTNDNLPSDAEFLGTVSVGESGFTTKNGSFDAVVSIAKDEARKIGGNILVIKEHKSPDFYSTIHRIKADVFRATDLEKLSNNSYSSSLSVFNPEHPDYAVIFFYRPTGAGALISYTVKVNNEKVFKAKNNSSAEVKIKKNGTYEICAKTESKASITLDIELGMEYYICCSLGMGAFVGRPELSLVDPSIGKIEYEKIKK